MYIYNALRNHGYSVFSLSTLEYIDISNLSKEDARKLILEREQYYLDLYKSYIYDIGYNIEINTLKIEISNETKLKISNTLKRKYTDSHFHIQSTT